MQLNVDRVRIQVSFNSPEDLSGIYFIYLSGLYRGYLPLTCAKSIPFSAASFLASGLANTRPFLGAAGAAAAAGAGVGAAAAGAATWNINENTCQKNYFTVNDCSKTQYGLIEGKMSSYILK